MLRSGSIKRCFETTPNLRKNRFPILYVGKILANVPSDYGGVVKLWFYFTSSTKKCSIQKYLSLLVNLLLSCCIKRYKLKVYEAFCTELSNNVLSGFPHLLNGESTNVLLCRGRMKSIMH